VAVSLKEIRERCEASLEDFIKVISPHRVLGDCHIDLLRWWTREDASANSLVLFPRAHQKSAMVAYRAAWEITRNPSITIMYVSATSRLAEAQVKFIKDILTSPYYTKLWPEMVNPEEGKREKWSLTEFAVDHPKRKEEGVREATVWATSVGATQTGMHCDFIIYDDLVVPENAYTADGRQKVASKYSQFASIANPRTIKVVVGTRYHPLDLYGTLIQLEIEEFKGVNPTGKYLKVYDVLEKQVEDQGDGSGEYLWPLQIRKDGKRFGFDAPTLAAIRTEYSMDPSQFRAQYYNDPNDSADAPIERDSWEYYDKSYLSFSRGKCYFKDRQLNVFASVDFAFSRAKKADYTAIVVIGIDSDNNVFVLDIDRFKSDKIVDYYSAIERVWDRWQFRKIRLEVTAAQQTIVTSLKELIKKEGMLLSVEEYRPTRHEGTKQERMQSTLEPKYSNGQMYHYRGGNCQVLEEELVLRNPPHDDVKDALASAIQMGKAPKATKNRSNKVNNVITHSRFGGIVRMA